MFNDSGNSPAIPGEPEIWFNPPQGQVFDQEHVTHVKVGEVVRTDKVSLRDFNLHRPDAPMEASASVGDKLVGGVEVDGWLSAIGGAFVTSVINMAILWAMGW